MEPKTSSDFLDHLTIGLVLDFLFLANSFNNIILESDCQSIIKYINEKPNDI